MLSCSAKLLSYPSSSLLTNKLQYKYKIPFDVHIFGCVFQSQLKFLGCLAPFSDKVMCSENLYQREVCTVVENIRHWFYYLMSTALTLYTADRGWVLYWYNIVVIIDWLSGLNLLSLWLYHPHIIINLNIFVFWDLTILLLDIWLYQNEVNI